jgi:hypothetical protein
MRKKDTEQHCDQYAASQVLRPHNGQGPTLRLHKIKFVFSLKKHDGEVLINLCSQTQCRREWKQEAQVHICQLQAHTMSTTRMPLRLSMNYTVWRMHRSLRTMPGCHSSLANYSQICGSDCARTTQCRRQTPSRKSRQQATSNMQAVDHRQGNSVAKAPKGPIEGSRQLDNLTRCFVYFIQKVVYVVLCIHVDWSVHQMCPETQ